MAYKGNKIKPMEGKSLLPVFAGKSIDREAIYWEHERNCAIRKGKWKLVGKGILGPDGPNESKWELYDIESDRSELDNLAATHPERVKELSDMFTVYAKRANVLPFSGQGKKTTTKKRKK